MRIPIRFVVFISSLCVILQSGLIAAPFRIQVLDEATSRGIPLVVLETSLNTRHVTDSNGIVAFNVPIAMGRELFFEPTSHGYHYYAPGLASGGVILRPEADSSATLVMQRKMIAERLYRITGAGIYRDTIALKENAPIATPILNAGVIGQDSALCAIYQDHLFWIWGDTARMRHPLATNFGGTGAFSDLPTSGGLPANQGINLHYIQKGDFVKPLVPRQPGDKSGVYWLSCVMNVPDGDGNEHLLAWCSNIEGGNMKTLRRWIMEYDPVAQEFHPLAEHPTTAPLQPGGHAVRAKTAHGDYMIFTGNGDQTRVRATYEAAKDPANYEALTCVMSDDGVPTSVPVILRDNKNRVVYRWEKNTSATGATTQRLLLRDKLLSSTECLFRPIDVSTGKTIFPHACSIAYNEYLGRWTMILCEIAGTSMLGEIWYLEADKPEGPWVNAMKIATHEKYSFYNPLQHPELLSPGDHHIYFEGTYTRTFSGAEKATPWYDYNQIMYRIDLDDPRLKMPEAVKDNIIF